MFTEAFMLRALIAAIVLAPLCSFLGVFVTARRMAFFSDTISHGALAGVALGFWWGMANPTLPMILFSVLIAGGILWLKENTELLTDTIMALVLSGSVAFGIVVLSLLRGYRGEIQSYLFGDILAIGNEDVALACVLSLTIGAWLFYQLSPLTLLTTEEEIAHVCGLPVRRLNYVFVLVLTLTVAMTIRLLGIILVTSLLVIPAAAGRNLSRNLRQQLLASGVIGLAGGIGGTLASAWWDIPTGPSIVLSCLILFGASLAGRKLWR